jgi:xylan 1,4-beta-xylosidase
MPVRLVAALLVLLSFVPALATEPPRLKYEDRAFGRFHVNVEPRPYDGRVDVTPATTLYFEVLVPNDNGEAGRIDADTITATLVPEGGDPVPMITAGRVFADGFTGAIHDDFEIGDENGQAVYIEPAAPLDFARRYTVEVEAVTFDGVPIDPAADSWSFTTRPEITDPTVTWSIDLDAPTVHWQGWFFSGLLKPDFNTSRLFDQFESYDLMDGVTATNPDAFSLQRDWPLTSDYWHNGDLKDNPWPVGDLDGNPNPVRELETRRVIAADDSAGVTRLTLADLPEGPLFGIPPNRPLSADFQPNDLVTIGDREKYADAVVQSVDDEANVVVVSPIQTPADSWILDYEGSHPPGNPEVPDNFTKPLCYLRKLAPVGTPVYYWTRIDDEFDIVHGEHGRRLQINFGYVPLDLAREPVPGKDVGHGAISLPKDDLQWHEVVREMTFHLVDRYGEATLDFYWSIGNEAAFGLSCCPDKNEFYRFYDVTANAILTAFEDRGLDAGRVILGGIESVDIGGVDYVRDALYHASGPADQPDGEIVEENFVCNDARFVDKLAARTAAICDAWSGKGAPLDFVSIHEYDHADQAAADLIAIKDDALMIEPDRFADLNVTSFEATPDWRPRYDPAANAVHKGNGFLPTWCADWMQRLVARAIDDERYAHHESVLTVWPFDYNARGFSSFTALMRTDEDGDGTEDRITTVKKSIFNYVELLAKMNRDLAPLPERWVAGVRLAGVRSRAADADRLLVFSHDKDDTQSRDETVFDAELQLEGVRWPHVTVRRWRVDRDHSSPYRAILALPDQELFRPDELAELEATDDLVPDGPPVDHAVAAGTLTLNAPLAVNGVTLVEITERDLDGDGIGDSADNCAHAPNPDQVDADGDLRGAACDCDDADADTWSAPGEVTGVTLAQDAAGATSIDWVSQADAAGPATRYDLVDGQLGDLRAAADFRDAACLLPQAGEPPVTDPGPDPLPGAGRYLLVRARNACGVATYGTSSLDPDPRTGLEDGDASPPAPDPCP